MICINNIDFIPTEFPNGELNFDKKEIDKRLVCHVNSIYFKYNKETLNKDILSLMFIGMYLNDKKIDCELIFDFCPYGQMDREMDDHIFSFKYFANMINMLNFKRVSINDPHSPVMTLLINNSESYELIKRIQSIDKYDLICYPDSGAAKKYSELYPKYNNYITGYKKRNLKTGEIIRYEILAEPKDIENKTILIIDDICMGGRTFKECAKALKSMGAKQVDLSISHWMPQSEEFQKNYKEFGIDNIIK